MQTTSKNPPSSAPHPIAPNPKNKPATPDLSLPKKMFHLAPHIPQPLASPPSRTIKNPTRSPMTSLLNTNPPVAPDRSESPLTSRSTPAYTPLGENP